MKKSKTQANDGEQQDTDRRMMGRRTRDRRASDGKDQAIEKSERQAGESTARTARVFGAVRLFFPKYINCT